MHNNMHLVIKQSKMCHFIWY